MAYDKIEEYKKRLAEMYKAKSNDKLNTDENVETLLTPNKTPNTGNHSFGGTMAELGDNLLTGWFKGLEGMVDTGITVAGHVGSWFGADTKWAEKAVNVDATDALMNDMFGGMREKANESYTNLLPETFQQGYDGITTSIGQMLPSIALGAVGGALGAGSKVVQGISMASFGSSAMGTSVEEGLNEGATFNEATGYGILQGGKEIATEYIGGKLFDSKVFGVFGDTTKVGIKALAKEAVGEGMEEVISTAFDPIVRKITIDKDKSLGELYEGIGEEMAMSFITGAITGGIMGGASTSVQVARYGVDGVNAMNTVQEANEVVQKMVALEKTVVNNESKTQKMEGYKKELENLYDTYTSQINNLETKYGKDSKKASKMTALSEYFSAIKNSSVQDLAIRDAIDEFNRKNKTDFKYNAFNQAEYTKIVKLIQGKNYDPSDSQSNAFILTDNGIVVNRDSEAYKEGRLYNTIGHEFIHSIEKTEGYKELFNNFVKGFTQEELNAKIQEYGKDKGYGFKNGAEYLLQEAFADYIGENVAINYKEFSKMLGTKSVWSKIKDALTGYRSSLTTDLKQVQSKVSNALKTATDTSMEMAKASRNLGSKTSNQINESFDDVKNTFRKKLYLEKKINNYSTNIEVWRTLNKALEPSGIKVDRTVSSWEFSYDGDKILSFNANLFIDYTINEMLDCFSDALFIESIEANDEISELLKNTPSNWKDKVDSINKMNSTINVLDELFEIYDLPFSINMLTEDFAVYFNTKTNQECGKIYFDNISDKTKETIIKELIEYSFALGGQIYGRSKRLPRIENRITKGKERWNNNENLPNKKWSINNEIRKRFETIYSNNIEEANEAHSKWDIRSRFVRTLVKKGGIEYKNGLPLIKEELYSPLMKSIKEENTKLNFYTGVLAFIKDDFENEHKIGGFRVRKNGRNSYLVIKNCVNLVKTNKHEKMHAFQEEKHIAQQKHLEDMNKLLNKDSSKEKFIKELREKGYQENELENELQSDFYSEALILNDYSKQHEINIAFEDAIAKEHGLEKIKFSKNPTDSNGTKLTEEQIDFFEESQVRDENGNLMVMYHGSPKAGFTVFNTRLEGSYFTSNREYAKNYSKFDESKIYEVYLNITKPFDINNPKCKKIYFEEFIKGGWSNSYDPYTDMKMINGLRAIDWTEGSNLYDFLQEKHPEYDGMIMDEYGDEDNDRGISYVAFYPEQIKLTSNENPTSSSDIRFSRNSNTTNSNETIDEIEFIDVEEFDKLVEEIDFEALDAEISAELGLSPHKKLLDLFGDELLNEEKERLDAEKLAKTLEKIEKRDKYNSLSPEQKRNLSLKKSYYRNYFKLVKKLNEKMSTKSKEFFKNSVVRTRDGYLIPMFHGTPNADMYSFDGKKIGKNGTVRGHGFYLINDYSYAEDYSTSSGKIIMAFVNIQKPLNNFKQTMTKGEVKRFVRNVVDSTGEDWLSNYGDVNSEGYQKVLDTAVDKIFEYNHCDSDIIEAIFVESRMEYEDYFPKLTEMLGYDGVVFDRAEGLITLVFNSNQIKDIANTNPTSNPDIRFSKNKKQIETKAVAKKLEQVEGEIVETGLSTEVKEGKSKTKGTQTPLTTDSTLAWKFYSNLVNDKVYNKSNADGFINAIEQDIKNKFGNDAKVDFKGNKEQLGKNLFQDLNNPSNVSKEQAVKHFLEYFSQIEVNGVSIKEALNNIDPVLYDDFIKQMNDNLVSLFNSGTQSKMDKVISTYTNRINKLKEALREERDYAKELLKTVKVLKSTVAKHKGKNASMTSLDISNTIPELNTLIVELEQLLSRTDYLKSDFRTYMAKVKEAFTKNEYLQRAGYLDADLLADMDTIIQNSATLGNKKITKDEMKILRKICNAINKVYNEYDETVLNGKRVVASQEAIEAIEQINVKDQKGKGVVSKLNAVENLTGQNMRTKLTLMSNKTYEDSFGRKIMGSLEQASNKKKEIYFDLTDSYHKKMTDKRRNLVKKLEKSNFSFGGVKFNDAQIITLYMTALRGDVATRHLLGEGVRIRDKNGLQTKAIKLTQENLDDIRKYVESNYADFIVELKEIFHKKAGKYYNETLSTRTGYEDSLEANYFPMKSSDLDFTANVMDQSKLMAQYQEFLSPSFTKEVQKTANNSLIIESIDVVVETFSRTMSNFAGITPTIQHLNRLFNTPVEYNGQTTSLMQYIKENYYENFDKEFSRLLINMQDRRTTGSVNKLGAKVRSGIASASLGGNPKIWFLQIASFPIAVSELGFFNSIRGVNSLPLDASKIAEISPYFKDRWENNDVKNAMLNTTNVAGKASTAIGKIGEFFSKPINWFSKMLDKAVIKASIAKVARDNKMTINQVRSNPKLLAEAVALAEQVCRRTQSQYDVLESGSTIYEASELMKSFYMFSSDARVIGNLLRTKLHDAISSKNFKPLLKTMTGVFLTQVIVALLDVAYRAFLDKTDDEDEDGKITDDMFHDFLIGTAENMTVNLIPIARDVYNKFVHGYDLNNVTLDYFNDLIDSISTMTNKLGTEEGISDKDRYNFIKVLGTTVGIPVKNLSEFTTAIFTKFNAEWAIRTQDILYSKSSSDSKNDIIYSYNNGKVSKLVGQTGALFSKAGLDTPNTKACTEMARLYSKGFTQIYPSVDISTFSHEGQLYKLSEAQQAKFSDIYNDATKELELLISSPAYYKLKDTDKAKAIKKVYSLYYNLAKAEFIQDYEYSPTEEALFELDAHDLVLYLVHIDTIKATTALSKKEQVIRYLNRQGLNKKELEAIFNILGYKVNSSNSILGNSMLSNSLFN